MTMRKMHQELKRADQSAPGVVIEPPQESAEDGLRGLLGEMEAYRSKLHATDRLIAELRAEKLKLLEDLAEITRNTAHIEASVEHLSYDETRWLYDNNVTISFAYKTNGDFKVRVSPRGTPGQVTVDPDLTALLENTVRGARRRDPRRS